MNNLKRIAELAAEKQTDVLLVPLGLSFRRRSGVRQIQTVLSWSDVEHLVDAPAVCSIILNDMEQALEQH